MKIVCLGGGPGGLYAAISLKVRRPDWDVTVYERNRADDTFGWGVVLSDQTLGNLAANDPVSAASIREHFAYWDDVAVVYRGDRQVSGGHGFCGIGRMRLLVLLQARARELGVDLRFETEATAEALEPSHDVVIACDGLNSRTRAAREDVFRPRGDLRACRFVWLGTKAKFDDAFTFIFEETPQGWMWAHAYQFDADTATFIVECAEATYRAHGFGDMSQAESIAVCERVFAAHLGGAALMTNAHHIRGSAWIRFPRVLCERWHDGKVVLLGDAAATAHFSIGSGTKLALESATALARWLDEAPDVPSALAGYENERRAQVLRIQSAAMNSLEWFEGVERYLDYHPVQFNYAQLTRSQRISHEGLRARDPAWLAGAEAWFQRQAGGTGGPPVAAPYQLRGLRLDNRVASAAPGAGLRMGADCLDVGGTEAARDAVAAGAVMVAVDGDRPGLCAAVCAAVDVPVMARIAVDGSDPVAAARAARDAGAAIVHVVPAAAPRRGRMPDVPLADRIRNEVGVPVMVGGAETADQGNGILLAGRADLLLVEDPASFAAAPFRMAGE